MSVADVPQSLPASHDLDPLPTPFRFSVEQYYRLGEIGIFSPEDRVELIEGQVIRMNPLGARHDVMTNHIDQLLEQLLPPGWHIRLQQTISWANNEPLPDLAIVRGKNLDYLHQHPAPKDVGLLIEISDSTLAYDRKVKGPLYASAGIVEYWIVNLNERQVEVHRGPQAAQGGLPASYALREVVDQKGTLKFNLDAHAIGPIRVADLLP